MTTTELTQTYACLMRQAECATDRKTAIKLIRQSTKVKELIGEVSWVDLIGEK